MIMPKDSLKAAFLQAPEDQLDHSLMPLIAAWNEPYPSALQILEVVDKCIHGSLASGFVVSAMQIMLEGQLLNEEKTLDDIIPLATWRTRG
jgi:hypothetical protein